MTLADFPALSVHIAPVAHSRFELSAAVIVQLLSAAHCVSHESPHPPVHDAPAEHESLQPCVALWHCPVDVKLHVVWLGQVQVEPEHEGGLTGPPSAAGDPELVEPPPHARKKSASKIVVCLVMVFVVGGLSPTVTGRGHGAGASFRAPSFAVTFPLVSSSCRV